MQLTEWAKTQTGMRGYCIRAYGEGEEGPENRAHALASPRFDVLFLFVCLRFAFKFVLIGPLPRPTPPRRQIKKYNLFAHGCNGLGDWSSPPALLLTVVPKDKRRCLLSSLAQGVSCPSAHVF